MLGQTQITDPRVIERYCRLYPAQCRDGKITPIEEPSIWEPITATVTEAGELIYRPVKAASEVTVGIGKVGLQLPTILTLGLIVAGLYLLTQLKR